MQNGKHQYQEWSGFMIGMAAKALFAVLSIIAIIVVSFVKSQAGLFLLGAGLFAITTILLTQFDQIA